MKMTVRELIDYLSAINPSAETDICWNDVKTAVTQGEFRPVVKVQLTPHSCDVKEI